MSVVVHKLLDWLRKELTEVATEEAHRAFVMLANEVLTADDARALADRHGLLGKPAELPRLELADTKEARQAAREAKKQADDNAAKQEATLAAASANPHLFPHLTR